MSNSCSRRPVAGVTPTAVVPPARGRSSWIRKRDDDFIRNRIKNGKEGAMPAFGAAFSDAQIDEIIKYIHALKPTAG